MSILCRVKWHRWAVWGTPERVPIQRVLTPTGGWALSEPVSAQTDLIRFRQARQCVNCGLVQHRWLEDP